MSEITDPTTSRQLAAYINSAKFLALPWPEQLQVHDFIADQLHVLDEGVKEDGRWVTIDEQRVFIGGPGQGSGQALPVGPRSFRDAAMSGEVVASSGMLGGVTRPQKLDYRDDGSGIWKPLWTDRGHDGASEVSAYLINRLLGGDDVPETLYAEWEGEMGTVQEFVDGATIADLPDGQEAEDIVDRVDPAQVERILALDVIIGNQDRHDKNLMWSINLGGDKTRLYAIDHGHATWAEYRRGGPGTSYNVVLDYFIPDVWYERRFLPFSEPFKARLAGITRNDLFTVLKTRQPVPRPDEMENAWSNLRYIIEAGGIPW